MKGSNRKKLPSISEEYRVYASVIGYTSCFGLILLLIIAVIYFSGILQPFIPLREIHKYWNLDLKKFQEAVQIPVTPWSWVLRINKADYLAYVPVAFLGIVTIIGYLRIFPIFVKQKNHIYSGIICAEVVLLLLVITGVVMI